MFENRPSKIRDIGNKDGWRLPTKDEMKNLGIALDAGEYWTCTETGLYNAYYIEVWFDENTSQIRTRVHDGNKVGAAKAMFIKDTASGVEVAPQTISPSGDSLWTWHEAVQAAENKNAAEDMIANLNKEIENI